MKIPFSKIDISLWGQPGGLRGYAAMPESLIREGYLPRENGHSIYYHEYGNPNGQPVMFIHGGPGGGSEAFYGKFFDPTFYRVILFDQRGCGKSTPNVKDDLQGALAHNTTSELIGDIEALRRKLGIESMHLFGGSWGTTLALAYAQAHAKSVKSLILRGIFTCTARDIAYFYQGDAAQPDLEGAYRAYSSNAPYTIPEALRDERMKAAYAQAWQNYVEIIPEAQRHDMVAAYHAILHSARSKTEKLEAATRWSVWEGVTSNLCHDTSPEGVKRFADPDFAIPFAAIENHYFMNGAFLDGTNREQKTLTAPANLAKIAHFPMRIVHGEYDQVCPVFQARELVDALKKAGANQLEYCETPCGHSMFEKEMTLKLLEFMDAIRDAD